MVLKTLGGSQKHWSLIGPSKRKKVENRFSLCKDRRLNIPERRRTAMNLNISREIEEPYDQLIEIFSMLLRQIMFLFKLQNYKI